MIQLFKPFMPELPEISTILQSGALAYGEYTKKFENMLKDYFGTPYLIVTSSFSNAISVAATSTGLSFGDEVIASPMACLASTQPCLSAGLKIKWCDIDPATGTLDPLSLTKVISPNTKAIIHNHFCGYPGYIDEINEIGKKNNILVIDDGIEAFGSEYKNYKVGNCGTDVTIFSLTPVRIPNTIDGGVVIFRDKYYYERSLRIRDCGIDREIFRDELGEINPYCDIKEIGYTATMSNLNGYIGTEQMKNLDVLLAKQRENAKCLFSLVSGDEHVKPIVSKEGNPNYWVFGMNATNKRETIIQYRKRGLYASGVHINNDRYSVFGQKQDLPGVNEFYEHFVALPCGWWADLKNFEG